MNQKRFVPKQQQQGNAAAARPEKTFKTRSSSRLSWLISRLVVLAILVAVVVYFAPPLIASGGLWKKVLAIAAPELAKQIDAKSLQVGWFASLEIRELV